MKTIDLRKTLKEFYNPSAKTVALIKVPAMQFAMLDGRIESAAGPAESQDFQDALQALYGISFTLKFMSKQRAKDPIDYPVMPLEALWWSARGKFDLRKPGDWRYTAMIMQPGHITPAMFAGALEQLRAKRGDQPAFRKLRLEKFAEGLCVQVMHIGPYTAEPETIARLHEFAAGQGCKPRGKHHEIYLGDPRRTPPSRLKTVLRQPVERK